MILAIRVIQVSYLASCDLHQNEGGKKEFRKRDGGKSDSGKSVRSAFPLSLTTLVALLVERFNLCP